MILERIVVRGYFGIRNLDIRLDRINALIGENGWGKSSLFNLLGRVFGDGTIPCRFRAEDFFIDEETGESLSHMDVKFIFRERKAGQVDHSYALKCVSRFFQNSGDEFKRIYYNIVAFRKGNRAFTRHYFCNQLGQPIRTTRRDIIRFVTMNPVFRIRDSRMDRGTGPVIYSNQWEKKISALAEKLKNQDKELNGVDRESVDEGLEALSFIIGSYVPDFRETRSMRYRSAREIASRPLSLAGMGTLQSLFESTTRTMKLIMVVFQDALMRARGSRKLPKVCFPILIMSDLESRLHPSYLMMFMSILDHIGFQKLFSTNSGDLLSCLGLSDIRRMVRNNHGDVTCYNLNEKMFSTDDLRRIASHVRLTRPMSLYARVWLLVEGETEIWLMIQLAAIAGYNLQAEGIRVIEFAQCGANPLINFAKQFGISWHLLCDGDEAGVKYASIASGLLKKDQQSSHHITRLPDLDIEHFLFHNGFESVYRKESGYGDIQNVTVNKIIERAIHRRSKPGLAINIVERADRLGVEGIPELLRNMFRTLFELSLDSSI
jgi:putative ATP-dependent endonuclease of OLD family